MQQQTKRKRDPRVYFGLMMGIGSAAAGAIRLHLFDGGVDWLFWIIAAMFVVGVAMSVWYIGMRRFHAETRTFVDRPARKPAPSHHDDDS